MTSSRCAWKYVVVYPKVISTGALADEDGRTARRRRLLESRSISKPIHRLSGEKKRPLAYRDGRHRYVVEGSK